MTMIVLTLTLGLLPGFAWLIFYLSEDPHPEPKRLIVLTFFAGIAFGFFAIVIEKFWNESSAGWGIQEYSVLSLLALALIEELMKFGAAYFAVGKSPELDEPIDRMIYMVVAALGFATLENIGAIAGISQTAGATMTGTAIIGSALQTDSLRFVGATLLHSLTSAIIGYHWARGAKHNKMAGNLIFGIAAATVLHAIFNYLILSYRDIAYTIIFLVIIGFFVLNDFEEVKLKKA